MYYYGWKIVQHAGHWYAYRFGVRINTNTREGLCRMIDNRPKW